MGRDGGRVRVANSPDLHQVRSTIRHNTSDGERCEADFQHRTLPGRQEGGVVSVDQLDYASRDLDYKPTPLSCTASLCSVSRTPGVHPREEPDTVLASSHAPYFMPRV